MLLVGLLVFHGVPSRAEPLVHFANTLQGANSRFELTHGNTFPAVAMPFGMHMWTLQTGRTGDGWKYLYEKDTIRGFQQAHQWESMSHAGATPEHVPGWKAGDTVSLIAPRPYQRLAGPWRWRRSGIQWIGTVAGALAWR